MCSVCPHCGATPATEHSLSAATLLLGLSLTVGGCIGGMNVDYGTSPTKFDTDNDVDTDADSDTDSDSDSDTDSDTDTDTDADTDTGPPPTGGSGTVVGGSGTL